MKSRLLIFGALQLAATIYPVAGLASGHQAVAEYLSDDMSYESQQGTESSPDMSTGSSVEGTEVKGEVETGKLPAGEPGDSVGTSGFESFNPGTPDIIEQNGLQYRPGIDDGP